jgi:hypothetical protein
MRIHTQKECSIVKKYLVLAALAASLGGCATTGNQVSFIQQIESAAVAACGFLPTAATITALLTTNPAFATAEEVASIICKAVTPATSGKLGAAVPTVIRGGKTIEIHGTFVR